MGFEQAVLRDARIHFRNRGHIVFFRSVLEWNELCYLEYHHLSFRTVLER